MKKIAIMGGTFDPIHFGHLVAAEAALDLYKLDKVVFVPAGNPPHKKDYAVTPGELRYLMTTLAVVANPDFDVSTIEVDRGGYSYAYETVKAFKEIYGEDIKLYFITGTDAILEILTWKNVEEIFALCEFIAAIRPGNDLEHLKEFMEKLPANFSDKINLMEVPALAISSTDIRRRVRSKRTIKYLLPESVEQYIYKNKLYNNE